MSIRKLGVLGLALAAAAVAAGCNDSQPFARAYRIGNRTQVIGGQSALADLGDYVLENDRIRIAVPQPGNSVGPGVFGGSLIDADLRRTDPVHRAGHGLDQFSELFPIANLAIPAVCAEDNRKVSGFCKYDSPALQPSVKLVCDGSRPCLTCYGRDDCRARQAQLDLSRDLNQDYADPDDPTRAGPAAPSEGAAIIRVEGMSGNYLEALGLVSLVNVKMTFRFRNDYILEPGARVVRIRTLISEASDTGALAHADGQVVPLPPLTGPRALFALLLGSTYFETELPGMRPGVAGGDFLFFGDRLKLFAPGVGFDVYRDIRNKFAVGDDPLNNPLAAPFLAAVGENLSYAIAPAEPEGRYLLPILSGAVTAGFTHGAHCHQGPCQGTAEQCANVLDCSQIKSFSFERLFAVGQGDVASAAAAIYEARGEALGRIEGRVIDARDASPVSHAEVHVYAVPESMADCRPGGAADEPYAGGAEGFEEQCLIPRDYQGAVNHLRTDSDALDLPVGRFAGELRPGRYYLLAKVPRRPASRVVAVEIRDGQSSEAVLELKPPARIRYEVLDASNQRVPAKLTIGQCLPNCAAHTEGACEQDADCPRGKCVELGPDTRVCQVDNCPADRACDPDSHRCRDREGCSGDGDCEPVERCVAGRCLCTPTYMTKAALGEGTFPPGIGRYTYTADGGGELEIEPGSWEVWASRGFEYSVDKQQVRAVSNRTAQLSLHIKRQVDTAGWISGDFHVHGQNSYDAVVKHRDRVMNFAGEGVEVLSTSDHDYITDLGPYVFELGLEKWLKTQVGEEVTSVELGHWLGFPLRYREWQDGQRVEEQGAIDWTGKFPDQIFSEIRGLGRYSADDTVVVVAHPRDSFFGYFDQYGLDSYDPSKVHGSTFEYMPGFNVNPLGVPAAFSGNFDALELFNSKRFELIRTPSAGEIRAYNQARSMIQAEAGRGADPAVIERRLIALDREYIKEILRRTPAEQDAIWESDGSGDCELEPFCSDDSDCDADAGQRCDRAAMVCYVPCADAGDCGGQPCQAGRCDPGLTPADQPCTAHEGVIDDWFRLLDYGVVRTGMGNSDTHQLFTQTEGGLPRNFIRLQAETAAAVDLRQMNRAIKSGHLTTSYGPFVELWLGQAEVGEVEEAGSRASVPLRVRVQSPGWFDVDRVEVYRSGRLIHVLTAAGDELQPGSAVDTSGLELPNPRVVDLDWTFDEPVPEADAWYVVIAMGLGGRDLSPVYTEHPYLKLQIGDVLSRSFSSVPMIAAMASSAGIPRVFRIYPYAVTNPVFLDVDGNGAYDAPHPAPAWASGGQAEQRSARQPLSSARIGGSPLADPTDGDTWRVRQLRQFMYLLQQGLEHGRAR